MGQAILSEITPALALSAYGKARSTLSGTPLGSEDIRKIQAYWQACNYLSLGMIYLVNNPLLKEPLKPEHDAWCRRSKARQRGRSIAWIQSWCRCRHNGKPRDIALDRRTPCDSQPL